jgi:hypothetical protein
VTAPVFERVYTMTDYDDGPRGGIADFRGAPHLYTSLFDIADDGSEIFELRPVDDETLQLALEDWAIWLRWDEAFHAGRTNHSTHPALPADRTRHDALTALLTPRLEALVGPVIQATASFRPVPGHADAERGRWLQVCWTLLED